MKSKIVSAAVVLLLCIALAGCGKKQEEPKLPEQTKASDVVLDTQTDSIGIEEKTEATSQAEVDYQEDIEFFGDISNNGGHFVGLDNMIYYIAPDEEAMHEPRLFAEYVDSCCGKSFLMAYNCETDGVETIEEGTFYGRIWFLDDKLFVNCQEPDEESYSDNIAIINLSDDSVDYQENEHIIGGDSKGNYVVTMGEWEENATTLYVYSSNQNKTRYVIKDYYSYIGLEDGYLVVAYYNDDEERIVKCIDINDSGAEYNLGRVPDRETDTFENYPEFEQCFIEDGKMYLSICWYEGTGHFFAEQALVEADLSKENSLKKVTAQGTRYDDGEYEGSFAFVVRDGRVEYAEGIPGSGYIKYTQGGEYGYIDDDGKRVLCGNGFGVEYDVDGELAFINEIIEFVDGKIFMVNNRLARDPDGDIGWRYSYTRKNTSIYVEGMDGSIARDIENIVNPDYSDEQ